MQLSISANPPEQFSKEDIIDKTDALVKEIAELQNILFAQQKHALLIVVQGMDASGKDGVIKDVFKNVNPAGISVKSFKTPSAEELAHDFLWRIHLHCPSKGMIQVFNRSHYEDVLIVRVHKWITEDEVLQRFEQINNFEKLLENHQTHMLKFYLHIDHDEQLERLEERKTNPKKRWKHNDKDFEESKLWDTYMLAYEDVFLHCNIIPWNIIPAGKNWYRNYLIAEKVLEKLKEIKLEYPA